MTTYIYVNQGKTSAKTQKAVERYLQKNNLVSDAVVEETESTKLYWDKRVIGQLLHAQARPGDALVIYEPTDLARSTCQMLEILMCATEKGMNVHFVKYDQTFIAKKLNKLSDMLTLMQCIESDFISHRTTDALARRRAAGLPLGRPKGRKNKSLKLDKHRKDILKYLELDISKASIAKLVGCHPQTLYDWMDRHGIEVTKDNVGTASPQIVVKNLRNVFNPETELTSYN